MYTICHISEDEPNSKQASSAKGKASANTEFSIGIAPSKATVKAVSPSRSDRHRSVQQACHNADSNARLVVAATEHTLRLERLDIFSSRVRAKTAAPAPVLSSSL
mmetsp:Transcript_10047/g.18240  ORF Transcript_10047/g.18240 Transcript_10047/m.18240 type:complete len:105 (+) Transcript_10047:91-405(+)